MVILGSPNTEGHSPKARFGGADDRGALVELAHQVEQQLPPGLGEVRIPMKAATDSDGKRPPVPIQNGPLWPGVELGVVIVAVGCSFDVIFALYGQSRWR